MTRFALLLSCGVVGLGFDSRPVQICVWTTNNCCGSFFSVCPCIKSRVKAEKKRCLRLTGACYSTCVSVKSRFHRFILSSDIDPPLQCQPVLGGLPTLPTARTTTPLHAHAYERRSTPNRRFLPARNLWVAHRRAFRSNDPKNHHTVNARWFIIEASSVFALLVKVMTLVRLVKIGPRECWEKYILSFDLFRHQKNSIHVECIEIHRTKQTKHVYETYLTKIPKQTET